MRYRSLLDDLFFISPQGIPTNGMFRSHDCYIFKLFWRLGLLMYPKPASTPNPPTSTFQEVAGRCHHIQFCVVLRMEARASCMLDKHSPNECPSEISLKYFGQVWWQASVWNPNTAKAGRLSMRGQTVRTFLRRQK